MDDANLDAAAAPRTWKQAFDRFGLAFVGVLATVLLTQAQAISTWVGERFRSDTVDLSDLPADAKLPPATYTRVVNEVESRDNTKAILSSTSCLEALFSRPWSELSGGLFMRGVICDNGNSLYHLTDMPTLPQRMVTRGIPQDWFKRKYIEEMTGAATPASLIPLPDLSQRPIAPKSPAVQLAQAIIICQRPLPDGRGLFQRLQTPNGCFDQIIDTATGRVVSYVRAPSCQSC